MLEKIGNFFAKLQSLIVVMDPFVFGILLFGSLFAVLMLHAHFTKKLDWKTLITCPVTNKPSLTRVLQLIGGITGTWVILYQTYKNNLATEMFFTYLCYVGAIEGWSKFITLRYGGTIEVHAKKEPVNN